MNNHQTQKQQIIKETNWIYLLWTVGIIGTISETIYRYLHNNKTQLILSLLALFIFISFAYITKQVKAIKLKELEQISKGQELVLGKSLWQLMGWACWLGIVFTLLIQSNLLLHWPQEKLAIYLFAVVEMLAITLLVLCSGKMYKLISYQKKSINQSINPEKQMVEDEFCQDQIL